MLTEMQIDNFKGWAHTGPVRLAPLTVLFGENSAGKTSLSQFLLLLKQTAESSDRRRVLHLGDESTLVDLGTYRDIVHMHDPSQALRMALKWTPPSRITLTDPLRDGRWRPLSGDRMEFSATIQANAKNQPYVANMQYRLAEQFAEPGRDPVLTVGMSRKGTKYNLEAHGDRYKTKRNPGRAWQLPAPFHFYGFPDEAVAYYQNTALVSEMMLQLKEELGSILHVGPLRGKPRRLYVWSGEQHTHVGQRGERAVEAILASRHRSYNFKKRSPKKSLEAVIADCLKRMGLIAEFKVEPIAEGRKEYEVLLKTHAQMPWVRLTDVGVGVSQVLPVLVECFVAPANSIVIFEQPEIHLHPRVQADLADVFVDAIRAREDNTSRNIQFIVESHSEHFLRRLQLRIAEGTLDQRDTAMYFIDTDGGSSRIRPLNVDIFGNIRNWPKGFFGDEMGDLVKRSKAQARRMAAGES